MKMMIIISSGRFDGIHIFKSFLARSDSSNGISHRAQVALIRSISAHEWVGVWTVSYDGYNVSLYSNNALFTRYTYLRVPSKSDGYALYQCITSVASSSPPSSWTGIDLEIVQKFTHEEENYHDDNTKYHTRQSVVVIPRISNLLVSYGASRGGGLLYTVERMIEFPCAIYWWEPLTGSWQRVTIHWKVCDKNVRIDVESQMYGW